MYDSREKDEGLNDGMNRGGGKAESTKADGSDAEFTVSFESATATKVGGRGSTRSDDASGTEEEIFVPRTPENGRIGCLLTG